jgi:hypothetical protein
VLSASDKIAFRHRHFLIELDLPGINLLNNRHADWQLVDTLHRKVILPIERRDRLACFEKHGRDTDVAFGEGGDF